MHEPADSPSRATHAVPPDRHTDQRRRSNPATARFLDTRWIPFHGAQDGDGHDRCPDTAGQVVVELRPRVPDAQTAFAVPEMAGFERITSHVAERPTCVRPPIDGFVRVQGRNVYIAVGSESGPLPSPWCPGRDDIRVAVRPGGRHPTLRRTRLGRHNGPPRIARLRLIPRSIPHHELKRIETSYRKSGDSSQWRTTRQESRDDRYQEIDMSRLRTEYGGYTRRNRAKRRCRKSNLLRATNDQHNTRPNPPSTSRQATEHDDTRHKVETEKGSTAVGTTDRGGAGNRTFSASHQ